MLRFTASILFIILVGLIKCESDVEDTCVLIEEDTKDVIKYLDAEHEGRVEMLNPYNSNARIQYRLKSGNSRFVVTRFIQNGIVRDTVLLSEKNGDIDIQPTTILDFLSKNQILEVNYSRQNNTSDLRMLCGDTLTVYW
jgi:hypothetical protein